MAVLHLKAIPLLFSLRSCADFHPDITAGCQPLPVNFVNNTNIIRRNIIFLGF